jgi:hypothetical protein
MKESYQHRPSRDIGEENGAESRRNMKDVDLNQVPTNCPMKAGGLLTLSLSLRSFLRRRMRKKN